jgi:predicted transcriptional regulator
LGKREPILISMEILASLSASPKGPTRLAQACNVNYGRMDNFTKPLLERGLIRLEARGEEQVYVISEEGYKLYSDWLEIWRRLPLD